MLNFVPVFDTVPAPYAEALARLASVRHALRLVDPYGGGPAPDHDDDLVLGAAWPVASDAAKRCFDTRSARVTSATAAGLEALVAEQENSPHQAASQRLVDEIRADLEQALGVIRA